MAKQIIRLTESDLHRLVKESVKRILRECGDVDGMIEDGIDEEGESGIGDFTYDVPMGGKGKFWSPATDRTPGNVGGMHDKV